jgi:hypothetical protein
MGKDLDNQNDATVGLPPEEEEREEVMATSASSRRRFAKNAAVGGAVFLTLGNRAAWGQSVDIACMSVNTLNSLSSPNYLISGPGRRQKDDDYELLTQNNYGCDPFVNETTECTTDGYRIERRPADPGYSPQNCLVYEEPTDEPQLFRWSTARGQKAGSGTLSSPSSTNNRGGSSTNSSRGRGG